MPRLPAAPAPQAFDALPLAVLLGGRLLCVHGGISPQLQRLADINAIARPTDVNPSGTGLLVDLLWADPCTHTAGGRGWQGRGRGAGRGGRRARLLPRRACSVQAPV